MIKRKVFILLFLIVLLTACNPEGTDEMLFEGESDNWYGVATMRELDQDSANIFAGELKLSYKGNLPVNDLTYKILLEKMSIEVEDNPLDENGEVIARISCSSCNYSSSGDSEIKVIVNWNNQSESLNLK